MLELVVTRVLLAPRVCVGIRALRAPRETLVTLALLVPLDSRDLLEPWVWPA